MRIGEFSRRHDVTIDTIRHYIELGLLLPEKDGAHFSFDGGCSEDLMEIKELKKLKFTLPEIQKLLIIRRLTKLDKEEDREYYRSFFLEKKNSLIREREQIDEMIAGIDKKAQVLSAQAEKDICRLGVPLSFLSMLECPKCRSALTLNSAQIDKSMIAEGRLDCRCGFTAQIENGIILLKVEHERNPRIDFTMTIDRYIESTAPEYINFMYRTIEWMVRRAEFNSEANRIILEPGAGTGYFLRRIDGMLPGHALYISVDHDIEALKYLKSYLEGSSQHTNYVFICCDFSEIPIKDRMVDLVIDYFGTTNYNFKKSGLLMNLLDGKVKQGGKWNGVHFCFDKYSKTVMQYAPECRPYFYKDCLLSAYENSNFMMLESAELGCVNRAGETEPFFVEGDNLFVLAYYGCKTSG